jgi:hypothetical protein
MATKPITYWGCDHNNALIKDICETWGDYLQEMSQADTLWLIARLAHEAWLECETDQPPSEEAEQVVNRLHELRNTQKMALIQALANS